MNNDELSPLDLAYQKLAFLEKEALLAVDANVKFQLQYKIEELKKEIANLENKSDFHISQPSNPQLKWFHYRWRIVSGVIILILLGLFLKSGNVSISGDCNAIISGSVGGNAKQDCK